MITSEKGKALIKTFEGLRLTAYKCPAGIYTIGYGSTRNVTPGMKITKEEAEARLTQDLAIFERIVSINFPNLKQNQFDALVSLAFNCGQGAVLGTIKTYIKTRDSRLDGWWRKHYITAGGVVLNGLVKRRSAEADMFFEK